MSRDISARLKLHEASPTPARGPGGSATR